MVFLYWKLMVKCVLCVCVWWGVGYSYNDATDDDYVFSTYIKVYNSNIMVSSLRAILWTNRNFVY